MLNEDRIRIPNAVITLCTLWMACFLLTLLQIASTLTCTTLPLSNSFALLRNKVLEILGHSIPVFVWKWMYKNRRKITTCHALQLPWQRRQLFAALALNAAAVVTVAGAASDMCAVCGNVCGH